MGEQLHQGDGGVRQGEVRVGLLRPQVREEGRPERPPVPSEVVLDGRRERQRRQRRNVEAPRCRALGPQPDGQSGPQGIEGHGQPCSRAGRLDLDPVPCGARRPPYSDCEVRLAVAHRRDNRHRQHAQRLGTGSGLECPEGRVGKRAGRVLVQPDVAEAGAAARAAQPPRCSWRASGGAARQDNPVRGSCAYRHVEGRPVAGRPDPVRHRSDDR